MKRILKTVFCIFELLIILMLLNPNTDFAQSNEEKSGYDLHLNTIKTATDPTLFISIWNVNFLSTVSSVHYLCLPLIMEGVYNFTVNWGDGSNNTITIWNQTEVKHIYSTSGLYTLLINGTIIGWHFANLGDQNKIIEIVQWGCLQLGNQGSYFMGCQFLKLSAMDPLNLTGITNLTEMFSGCDNLGSSGNLDNWDVSKVTDMSYMFYEARDFNQPIGAWNVSNVIDMSWMFYNAQEFNQPIEMWDVSHVTNMSFMFNFALAFNQPIGTWNVSNVVHMIWMFSRARDFNQPIGTWNVSKVIDMGYMFELASSFNQPLGTWNVSNVVSMWGMFYLVTLSTANYDHLLRGWSQLSLQHGVDFNGGKSKYSSQATAARQLIIDTFDWTISDGGEEQTISGYSSDFFIGILMIIASILVVNEKRKMTHNAK